MSFAIYLVGVLLVIAGVDWALVAAGVAPMYVVIATLVLVGLGVLSGVTKTRSRDVSR